MLNKNMLRRNYLIIRRIMKKDVPTKKMIMNYLTNHDIAIDNRTLDRDLGYIRYNLGVAIEYDHDRRGYYIDVEISEHFDKLLYFIGLAENADVILDALKNKQALWQYLSISPSGSFKGVENIGVLLQAIRNRLVISFNHLNYSTGNHTPYSVEPYLLKEFEGRWYLFGYVADKKDFRTFGLDRMSDLEVTATSFKRTPQRESSANRFDDVYGLTYMPNQQNPAKETVSFRCNSDYILNHFLALPLHHSQKAGGKVISLRLIINPELENKLLSYGEQIEVLMPESLRKTMKGRLAEAGRQYRKN
ncbi:MAG: WYL domain-containing protein [Lentimicrobiaceae bacterium]|nr:WYL domain-containing protein [Lentimicrobiaceae bacterium]